MNTTITKYFINLFLIIRLLSAHFTINNFQVIDSYFACRNVNNYIIFDKLFKFGLARTMVDLHLKNSEKPILIQFSYPNLVSVVQKNQKTKLGVFIHSSGSDPAYFEHLFQVLKHQSLVNENLALLLINEGNDQLLNYLKLASINFKTDLVIGMQKHEIVLDKMLKNDNYCVEIIENYCFIQIWKLRDNDKTSLITNPIDFWDYENKTNCFSNFKPIEKRLIPSENFTLRLGKKNATIPNNNEVLFDNTMEDDNDKEKLMEISNYFKMFFKANIELTYYPKASSNEDNGDRTGLLKAVQAEEIDLALAGVISSPERYAEMAFSHEILKSIKAIYIKPEKSNQVRDIFLIPFNNKLIGCVVATGVICSLIMTLINRINRVNQNFGDAIIWCIGIFSMQGSITRPKTCSGNVLLIILLIFSLIIYNSYSAFITSILSVKIINIRSVGDLLNSDYTIGYAKNSEDEAYLRAMNDTQLQQIYLRGYLKNNVFSVTEGLLKVVDGNYGFFASVNSARTALQVINNYRCQFDVMEISISSTKNSIAFPMFKGMPFKKIFNLGIIRMYETGIHKYIENTLVPSLPQCEKRTEFQSAHLADLISAFAILAIGIFVALVILLVEILFKRRQKLWNKKQTF